MVRQVTSEPEKRKTRWASKAARTFARAAKLILRAERKAGEFLAGLKLRGGDRKSKGHRASLKLADMDISSDQSKRWQKEASVPEKDFQRYSAFNQMSICPRR